MWRCGVPPHLMKLKEIPRTATFAWTRDDASPSLVTGTAAGAISADFDSSTHVELWNLDLQDKSPSAYSLSPKFSAEVDARFYDIAVSHDNKYVAGAMESGAVNLWTLEPDSLKLATSASQHSGAVRAVAFNSQNSLVSAGQNGQVFVWDPTNMDSPTSPGTSARQDDVLAVAWNNRVSHILATAGSTGFTSIWDLRKKREVIHLHYSPKGARLPSSSVCWHADNSTKLVTCSSDDQSPVVLVWDLRNANSPEAILEGHTAGVLSVDWCRHDPNLLLSSGKDNRTLLWNPSSQELLGEYPISVGWVFKTKFNPHSPDLFASSSMDGKVTVQALQDTSEPTAEPTKRAQGDAFWDSEEVADAVHPQFRVRQAPAWLKRPISVSFGFGGKLVIAEKGQVKITQVKESAQDVSTLKEAFANKEFTSLFKENDQDWTVLKSYSEGKSLVDEPKEEEIEEEEFVVAPQFNPSGDFTLFDGKNDKVTKLVLSGNTAKAVDVLIDSGDLADALALASFDDSLLEKARNAYLNNSAKPYLRAAWSKKNDLGDLVNVELDAWPKVLGLVKDNKKDTAALGKKLYKAGRRDEALKTFLIGNNIDQAAAIWLDEMSAREKELRDASETPYTARGKALQEVIEKIVAASKGAAVDDAEPVLYDAYRDFADIVASQGELDLAKSLLDLLPKEYAAAKERVSGPKTKAKTTAATGKRYPASAAPTFNNGHYAAPAPDIPGSSSPYAPAAGVSSSPYAPKGSPYAPAAATTGAPTSKGAPYAPSSAATAPPGVKSPLAPKSAPKATPVTKSSSPYAPKNPYAPAAPAAPSPVAPPPVSSPNPYPFTAAATAAATSSTKPQMQSSAVRPPKQGWNDLPEIASSRRTPVAPKILQTQSERIVSPPPPPGSVPPRSNSNVSTPSSGPARGAYAPPKANPYAPPPTQSSHPVSSPPAQASYPRASNPYAPAPGSNPAPKPASPVPAAKPAPPPPGKARTKTAASGAAGPSPATPVSQEATNYPPGDRSHLSPEAKKVFESFTGTLESVRPLVSQQYPKQFKDTEQRLNILFDTLNNAELPSAVVTKLVALSSALGLKNFDEAAKTQHEIATQHTEVGGKWMTGVKRLCEMAKALPS